MKCTFYFIAFISFFICPVIGNAQVLSLEDYLHQVKEKNSIFLASTIAIEAAELGTSEADLLTAYTLSSSASSSIDRRDPFPAIPSMARNKSTLDNVHVDLSKNTDIGVTTKLSYGLTKNALVGIDPHVIPKNENYQSSLGAEVSLSLLKNKGGEDIRNAKEVMHLQAKATESNETFKRRMIMLEAEGTYWRLAISRDSIAISQDNLKRSQKLLHWMNKKIASGLFDNADLLQVEALRDTRGLELQMAYAEELSAMSAFNRIRGINADKVSEEVEKIDATLLDKLVLPVRAKENRPDIDMIKTSIQLAQHNLDLMTGKYKPTLDLFSALSFNGQDPSSFSTAIKNTFKSSQPVLSFGLRFSMPLVGDNIDSLRSALLKGVQVGELTLRQKELEVDREWQELESKLSEVRKRIVLSEKLMTSQKRKAEAEQDRQQTGRSTTSQVIMSETDFSQSKLNLTRVKAEYLNTVTRMKIFGGEL